MELKTDGTDLPIREGKLRLSAHHSPGDVGPGLLALRVEDQATSDDHEVTLSLDPWSPDTYDVYEWVACQSLVISGADRIVILDGALQTKAAIGLGYEEAERLDRPWFAESREHQVLILATERRVWCLDHRLAIRWCWSAQTRADARWIRACPEPHGGDIRVPVGSLRGEATVVLSMNDAVELSAAR